MNMENKDRQERIKEVSGALIAGRPYLRANIYPRIEKISRGDGDFALIKAYTDGCYLINVPFIQSYPVKYYPLAGSEHFYAIAEKENKAYGFLLDPRGVAQYISLDDDTLKERICKTIEPKYSCKTVSEIVDTFNIPDIETFASRFREPLLVEIITNILEKSKWYLKNVVYARVDESVEWADFANFSIGSVMAHNPLVIQFKIIGHYRIDGNDCFVFENSLNDMHYFVMENRGGRNLMRYESHKIGNGMKKCKGSEFIGKTVHDIVKQYDIPLVNEIPDIL